MAVGSRPWWGWPGTEHSVTQFRKGWHSLDCGLGSPGVGEGGGGLGEATGKDRAGRLQVGGSQRALTSEFAGRESALRSQSSRVRGNTRWHGSPFFFFFLSLNLMFYLLVHVQHSCSSTQSWGSVLPSIVEMKDKNTWGCPLLFSNRNLESFCALGTCLIIIHDPGMRPGRKSNRGALE